MENQLSTVIRSNLPLFQAGAVESSLATSWTTLLSLEIDADEEVYPTYINVILDTGDNQEIRITSNNVELQSYKPVEGIITIMFFNNELRFTSADKRPLVIQYRTDGVVGHEFSGEAQITGIRRKLKK